MCFWNPVEKSGFQLQKQAIWMGHWVQVNDSKPFLGLPSTATELNITLHSFGKCFCTKWH